MIFDNLDEIQKTLENKDIEKLEEYISYTPRVQNSSIHFKTALMLSANNLKHLNKLDTIESDCVMLNLEDGVAFEDKGIALVLCAIFLSRFSSKNKKIIVRVNALDEGGYDEITYLNQFKPDAIRVPKIRDKSEVKNVLALLDESIDLHLSIETKESYLRMSEFKIDQRVTHFYLGILDLLADMKLPQNIINTKNYTFLTILSNFLLNSKSLGVEPVSFVFQDYKNDKLFKEFLELEKSLGYESKACLSPTQVIDTKEVFGVSQDEIDKANTIVKLFEMHKDMGITGFSDDEFGFIDEPIYKGALSLLSISKRNIK